MIIVFMKKRLFKKGLGIVIALLLFFGPLHAPIFVVTLKLKLFLIGGNEVIVDEASRLINNTNYNRSGFKVDEKEAPPIIQIW